MSTLPVTNPTLLDLANRMDPNGKIPDIIELLNETNGCSMILSGRRVTSRPATRRRFVPACRRRPGVRSIRALCRLARPSRK